MSKSPTVLNISKQTSSQYRYTLHKPDEPFAGPLGRVFPVTVDAAIVKLLCTSIRDAVEGHVTDLNQFITYGQGLHQQFFPRTDPDIVALLATLRELQSPLLITTDDAETPWELFYDDEVRQFLGVGRSVGRRLLWRGVPRTAAKQSKGWRCLIIANPNQGDPRWELPEASEEAWRVRKWLEARNVDCSDFLEGSAATYKAVVERLLFHDYDFIHVSGHILRMPRTGEHVIRLHRGKTVTANNIRTLVRLKGTPTVFLNGCRAANINVIAGLTDAFLEAGAQLVIGSSYDVPDEGAGAFAEVFYDRILHGETAGDAMCAARAATQQDPANAAAWACFVMYGDPCLRIEFKTDKLEKPLADIGLSRRDFEPSADAVIEQAFQFGETLGQIGTAHLLAAMINGDDDFLRDRLLELLPGDDGPALLRAAFGDLFTYVDKHAPVAERVGWSPNGEKMLRVAHALVKERDPAARIGERDLVQAFVLVRGGNAGGVLAELGVDISALAPYGAPREDAQTGSRRGQEPETASTTSQGSTRRPAAREAGGAADQGGTRSGGRAANPPRPAVADDWRFGPLTRATCDDTAWDVLVSAALLGFRQGLGGVDASCLFSGLLSTHGGSLAQALGRLGIAGSTRQDPEEPPDSVAEHGDPLPAAGEIMCSRSVGQILGLAQANAAANRTDRVSDRDLLAAFVQQGGGQAGQALHRSGIVVPALTSSLFVERGRLDRLRFDSAADDIVERMLDAARRKRHPVIGRTHLFHGLLMRPGSLFARLLADQHQDAELLGERLYAALDSGQVPAPIELRFSDLGTDLIGVLCAAEQRAASRRAETIGEADLLAALIDDGGGRTGEMLAAVGVRLSRLRDRLRAE